MMAMLRRNTSCARTCPTDCASLACHQKRTQIQVYGARLVPCEGPSEHSAQAAHRATRTGCYHPSDCFSPFFIKGPKTIAFEIVEQLDWRCPDNVALPVGNGTLPLGAWKGFRNLQRAGIIERLPRIFPVQGEKNCAPLCKASQRGKDEVAPLVAGGAVAEDVAIASRPRSKDILAAIGESSGTAIPVADEEILRARKELAHQGLFVEPTSAAGQAALPKLAPQPDRHQATVVPLTGSGLKGKARAQ